MKKIRELISYLYKRYVDKLYVPEGTEAYVVRYPKVSKDCWGEINCIRIFHRGGYGKSKYFRGIREYYIHSPKAREDNNGIKYLNENNTTS